MFKQAIVKKPCKQMVKGLTTANLGLPNYDKALLQHSKYIEALKIIGLDVICLEADELFPDSTFIEDTALLTPNCAIITNPGADERKGEVVAVMDIINKFYSNIENVNAPGTVEAGDIMMVGKHFYIGLSKRTNIQGAEQLISFLNKFGLSGSTIKLKDVLHLKTGLSYLENNNLIACGEFIKHPDFKKFNIIPIDEDEAYSANCVWINGYVLIAKGFPKTKKKIQNLNYKIIELDVSEFQKLDGGLSCLSLRF